jgi:Double zinc ribbon
VYLNTRAARTVAPPPEDAYAPPQVRAVHEETTAMKPPFVADTDTAEAEVGGGAATFEQATTPTSNSLDITPPPSPVGSPPFGDLSRERGAPAAKPPLIARRTCRFCGGEFPSDRDVQYCPHCGVNAVAPVCSGCGAELETNWKFCVVCGKRANTDE